MRLTYERSCEVAVTARVLQMRGMFDVQPEPRSVVRWDVDLPIEGRPWSIGLVYGPSGSGKSTLAEEAWPGRVSRGFAWASDASVLDGFPAAMGVREVVGLLSSVGFSSPPAWLRPYGVLSTGQRFRVDIARALAESDGLTVVDEFTSVVDRQVAQVASASVAKAVRARGGQFVAVSCHHDIVDWLQPDWTLNMADGAFDWRLVQRRPSVTLEIRSVHHRAWGLFAEHHYLTRDLHKSAQCFVAFLDERPVAFVAMVYFPHAQAPARHFSRLVILPDFQGLGLTVPLCEAIAEHYHGRGEHVAGNFAHPAMVAAFRGRPHWRLTPPRVASASRRSRERGRSSAGTWGDPTRRKWRVEYVP